MHRLGALAAMRWPPIGEATFNGLVIWMRCFQLATDCHQMWHALSHETRTPARLQWRCNYPVAPEEGKTSTEEAVTLAAAWGPIARATPTGVACRLGTPWGSPGEEPPTMPVEAAALGLQVAVLPQRPAQISRNPMFQ